MLNFYEKVIQNTFSFFFGIKGIGPKRDKKIKSHEGNTWTTHKPKSEVGQRREHYHKQHDHPPEGRS